MGKQSHANLAGDQSEGTDGRRYGWDGRKAGAKVTLGRHTSVALPPFTERRLRESAEQAVPWIADWGKKQTEEAATKRW